MALLICHTLRHSFNAKEHAKLQGRRRSVGLFVKPPQVSQLLSLYGLFLEVPLSLVPYSPLEPWLQQALVSLETNEQQLRAQSTRAGSSTLRVEDLQEVVAAHLPTFYFHPAEQCGLHCQNSLCYA